MPTLSTPIGELRSEYGVVVIGSGYGGAIAAYRMAENAWPRFADPRNAPLSPDYSVCVLERGLERQAGDYPESSASAMGQIQVDTKRGRFGSRSGLFDIRINDDVSVLVGCGLGGTSQINAGVMLRPRPNIFEDGWPEILSRPGALAQEYQTVQHGLGVNTIPPTVPLSKVTWLKTASARVGGPPVDRAPVAVSLSTEVDGFKTQRQGCVLCGNCITGCNHSAKNTVPMNFLAGAANLGAAIFCGMHVQAIEPSGGQWLLHVRIDDPSLAAFGSPEMTIRARMVFLSAGTLGSTEILLRSRNRFQLPLSQQLGHHFSCNGDAIAFGYNCPETVDGFGYAARIPDEPSVGPTIAATLDDRPEGGALIQEGAIPGSLGLILRFLAPLMARLSQFPMGRVAGTKQQIWREIDSMIRGPHHGALLRTQTFLAMAEDDGNGQMGLAQDRLRIKWNGAGKQHIYTTISKRFSELTRAMGGRYVINPFWSRLFGRRLMTVHPLGGCRLADDSADGVVNADGQVFASESGKGVHEGLYVCDGSIIPRPLGTNPALTIAALAERIATKAAAHGTPGVEPQTAQPGRVDRSVRGIRYAERLRGHVSSAKSERFELVLQISAEDIDRLIEEPDHETRLIGVAHVPDAEDPGARRLTISEGTLRVLVDDERYVQTKLLIYQMKLTSDNGNHLWLRGHKTVSYDTLKKHPWLAVTQVPFVVFEQEPPLPANVPHAENQPYGGCHVVELWDRTRDVALVLKEQHVVAAGVVSNGIADAVRMVLSVRVSHERRFVRRLRAKLRYGWWFLDALIQARVWPIRRTRRINPLVEPEGLEPAKDRLPFSIKDPRFPARPRYEVSRYKALKGPRPGRRPVMLAPGFGMSTYAFQAAGDASIAEYLHARGYDVWLFDYRGSDKLDVSLDQFDLDVLAKSDFPDAIKVVSEHTGQPVQMIAHCVASLTMQMALLEGTIGREHLHSVLLSQSYAFLDHPFFNRLKAKLRLPDVLAYLRFRPVLTADYDLRSSVPTMLLDRLLHFYPSRERCHDGVCRRLLLMYGEVVRHDQLDKSTHESIYHLFDRANLTTFKHLAKMIARGKLVDRFGRDVYLQPANGKNIRVPLTLLQGMANGLFRPAGMRRTHTWLVEHGGFGTPAQNAEQFTRLEIDGYGHLDNFIGKHARRDVFEKVANALEAMDAKVRRSAADDHAA